MRETNAGCSIIDVFPAFTAFWEAFRDRPVNDQIDGWMRSLGAWPELLNMQIRSYADDGEDFRQVARERIFPTMDERVAEMARAYDVLVDVLPGIVQQAQDRLAFRADLTCVIYVGIGCGAGWATTYDGWPAVLFGLENIADEGWSAPETLAGLAAHEIGHLAHFAHRAARQLPDGSGPWWTLYTEGYAQRSEHRVLGRESWHMNGSASSAWLAACREKTAELATLFLHTVDAGDPTRAFFGSWFRVLGLSQTGYFLGHEVLRGLEEQGECFEALGLLGDFESRMREGLRVLAQR